jgi:hypothetical protein
MLDLDATFDPGRQITALPPATPPTLETGTGPEDLPPDWRVGWEERAAVLEYDGGHLRERAEALALAEVLGRMLQAGERPPPRP